MKITTTAYNDIIKTLGSLPAEQGGIGFGTDDVITDFVHDKFAKTTGGTYTLNTPYLNPKIKAYDSQGKSLKAIFHTHPHGYASLSPQDKKYFKSQFKNFEDLEKMYTPIIFSAKDGAYDFHAYAMYRDGTIKKEVLSIVPDDYQEYKSRPKSEDIETSSKKVTDTIATESVSTEKEVTINLHNTITQKGELEPVVIYVDTTSTNDDVDMQKVKQAIEASNHNSNTILEPCLIKIFEFSKVYHGLFILFALTVLGLLISLLPTFHKFIVQTLLN